MSVGRGQPRNNRRQHGGLVGREPRDDGRVREDRLGIDLPPVASWKRAHPPTERITG